MKSKRTVIRSLAILIVLAGGAVLTWGLITHWGRRSSCPAGGLPAVDPSGTPLPPLEHPRLLVEKTRRRLTVYDGRKVVKRYRIALGWGRGDKVREGDGCTPEGDFYICTKNPRARFHRSLGLSYPNVEDAERGLRDGLIDRAAHDEIARAIRRRTRPPWKTPLGGQIMLHGHGTKSDWTAGCAALSNADITELYEAIRIGTPVRIVR